MPAFKLDLNIPGFNEVRRSPAIQADLHERAERIARAAGGEPDFIVEDSPSRTRARVVVIAATAKAQHEEATNRVLTRAFDAGRG